MSLLAKQKFTAVVELTWEYEPFPGDPDDLYEIAELEKAELEKQLETTLRAMGEGTFHVQSVKPVL